MTERSTIGRYLLERLEQLGVKHIFGIPGDYVLRFYDLMVESPLDIVATCSEAGAAFAADAYARVNGLGALCVTYCVGGLSLANSIAGAYAEKSPVVVISGSPGLGERVNNPLLHHKVKDFRTQYDVFRRLTVAACLGLGALPILSSVCLVDPSVPLTGAFDPVCAIFVLLPIIGLGAAINWLQVYLSLRADS